MTLATSPTPQDTLRARQIDRAELAQIPTRAQTAAEQDDLAEIRTLQARALEIGTRHEGDQELKMLAVRAINACMRRGVGVMGRTRRPARLGAA